MITNMYSVFDRAAGAFMAPFFTHSDGLASRMLSDAVHDPKTSVGAHPNDYDLFALGAFDDQSASFAPLVSPRRVCAASDFLEVTRGA